VTVASAAGGRYVAVSPQGGYRAGARSRRRAVRFFLKPTGLGTYVLHDDGKRLVALSGDGAVVRTESADPAAEWSLTRRSRRRFAIRAGGDGRVLAAERRSRRLVTAPPGSTFRRARFRLRRARGCKRFPEAATGARGRPFRGTRRGGRLVGLADPHVHIAADLRAGGLVIAGSSFARFGIADALGRDADVHGSDGSLDVTGNLLRSGSPAGTHDTHGWPTFAGWPASDTYTHQQVYYRWLERSWMGGLRLVVAQTVEDEPLCTIEPRKSHSCDEADTIELEVKRLRALQHYVDAQHGGRGRGWFRLVYGPAQARRLIRRGKLAVVIGAESSGPFGCSQYRGEPRCDRAGIDRGIARMRRLGVRTLFVAHWVDNALAGAALEGGDKGTFIGAMQLSHTGEPFSTGPCPHPGQGEEVQPEPIGGVTGRQCNTKGLTPLGDYAVRRLMDEGMLIEVDHMSERAREQVLAIAEERSYPVVSSHTGTGGAWDPSELRSLYAEGGFGSATLDEAPALPDKVLGFQQYFSPSGGGVGLSSDTGGFAALPGPAPLTYPFRAAEGRVRFGRQRTGTRTFSFDRDGMAHYGLLPDYLASVQRQERGGEAVRLLFGSADAYVRTWERAVRR
jgi:hypothetical protein